jgi:hypothetical protein
MSTRLQSADQVRYVLEQIGIQITDAVGDKIGKEAKEGPEEKRRQYPAASYLGQIERNAIYLREGTMSLMMAMVDYLHFGRPLLSASEKLDFVNMTRVVRPQQTTLLHLNYIENGCAGCEVHDEHAPYARLREMVVAGDLPAYTEEMEFSYIYYQGTNMMAQYYLGSLLENHQLARSASSIAPQELFGVVQERVFLRTDLCLGNVQLVASPEVQEFFEQQASFQKAKQKKWWQIWK